MNNGNLLYIKNCWPRLLFPFAKTTCISRIPQAFTSQFYPPIMFYGCTEILRRFSTCSGQYLVVIAMGAVLSGTLYLLRKKRQRKGVVKRAFSWILTVDRARRISTSRTPPRSVSPGKRVPTNIPSPVGYEDLFPPSRRESLAKIVKTFPSAQQGNVQSYKLDQVDFKKGLISFTADYRECGPSTYTPTELSMEEVKALGDFPNYAELSGVPLPEAYEDFKVETALARPYRPLRWAYHQTMCKDLFCFGS